MPAAPDPTNVSQMGSEGFTVPTRCQVEAALPRADVDRSEQRGLVAVATDGDAGRITTAINILGLRKLSLFG